MSVRPYQGTKPEKVELPEGGFGTDAQYNPKYIEWLNKWKPESGGQYAGSPYAGTPLKPFDYKSEGGGSSGGGYGGGYGGGGYGYSGDSVEREPQYNTPQFKNMPQYNAPSWNQSEIDAITQQRAAPGLRALRAQVNRVSGANYENPNVKRMTLRDALAGYGQGLSSVIGQAGATAASEYGQKYGMQVSNAKSAYQSAADAAMAENEAMRDAAHMKYGGELAGFEAKTAAATAAAGDVRKYALEQKALDSAWERWKRQQIERQQHPEWGSGGGGLA